MNKGIAPQERDAQLGWQGMSRAANVVTQTGVTEKLSWSLIDQAEENSEGDVEKETAADEFGRAILSARCGCWHGHPALQAQDAGRSCADGVLLDCETRLAGDIADCDRWSGSQRSRSAYAASGSTGQSNASESRRQAKGISGRFSGAPVIAR